jgi:hypothetical protein
MVRSEREDVFPDMQAQQESALRCMHQRDRVVGSLDDDIISVRKPGEYELANVGEPGPTLCSTDVEDGAPDARRVFPIEIPVQGAGRHTALLFEPIPCEGFCRATVEWLGAQ